MVTKNQGVQPAYRADPRGCPGGADGRERGGVYAGDTTEPGAVLDRTGDRHPPRAHTSAGTRGTASVKRSLSAIAALTSRSGPSSAREADVRGGGPGGAPVYRSKAATCGACPLSSQCLATGRRTRAVERGPDDPIRQAMVAPARTPEGAGLHPQRMGIMEPVFAMVTPPPRLAAGTSEFTLRADVPKHDPGPDHPPGGDATRRGPCRGDPGAGSACFDSAPALWPLRQPPTRQRRVPDDLFRARSIPGGPSSCRAAHRPPTIPGRTPSGASSTSAPARRPPVPPGRGPSA